MDLDNIDDLKQIAQTVSDIVGCDCIPHCCTRFKDDYGPEIEKDYEKLVRIIYDIKTHLNELIQSDKDPWRIIQFINKKRHIPTIEVYNNTEKQNVCTLYKDDKCLIYKNRPLTCGMYPFFLDDNGVPYVDTDCKYHNDVCKALQKLGIEVRLEKMDQRI